MAGAVVVFALKELREGVGPQKPVHVGPPSPIILAHTESTTAYMVEGRGDGTQPVRIFGSGPKRPLAAVSELAAMLDTLNGVPPRDELLGSQ